MRPRTPRLLIVLATGSFLALTWTAMATRPPSERTIAVQLISQTPSSSNAIPAPVQQAIKKSRQALQRADQAKASGDLVHAEQLEGLAREWAELARDLSQTISAEKNAAAVQSASHDTSARVRQAQAMLEQLQAEKARAQGELQSIQATPSLALSAVPQDAGVPTDASAPKPRPQTKEAGK